MTPLAELGFWYVLLATLFFLISTVSYFLMNQPFSVKYKTTIVFFTIFWWVTLFWFWWANPIYDFENWLEERFGFE